MESLCVFYTKENVILIYSVVNDLTKLKLLIIVLLTCFVLFFYYL